MNLEKYPVKAKPGNKQFEFTSVGPKGQIIKVVSFQKIQQDYYNFAFGDMMKNGEINYNIRSNNGDRDKVLATIASVVPEFLKHHVNAEIFAEGETAAKTRLYQIGLNKHFREITYRYTILGYCNEGWERFQPGKNYEAFIIATRQ